MTGGPKKIEICVVFVKLGEIDTAHEQFSADVLVKAKWREPLLDGKKKTLDTTDKDWLLGLYNPRLFIENTIGDHKEHITNHVVFDHEERAFMCENRRLKATFIENLELNDFPFDVQDLTVAVASERYSTELEFVNSPDDIHRVCKRSFVDEQEWKLYKHIDTVADNYTDDLSMNEDLLKPMYLVRCRAARRSRFFLANMYTMSFLIVALAFTTWSVAYYKPEYRLKLGFALLLTAVTFKLVVSNSLPKISYVTYLDQYNFMSLAMIVITCIWHSICSILPTDNVVMVDHIALATLGVAYFLYNVIYGVRLGLKVYKRRSYMHRRDEDYVQMIKKVSEKNSNGFVVVDIRT